MSWWFSEAKTDADGQPNPAFNAKLRQRRDVDEVLGICKGIILDGVVSDDEVLGLTGWIEAHPDSAAAFPLNVLVPRLEAILADGSIDRAERTDLQMLLEQVVGGDPEDAAGPNPSTKALFDDPPPLITVPNHSFAFTGKFFFGTRSDCHAAVATRGGMVHTGPRKDTSFLIVGELGSRDWIHSTHGTKLEKAIGYRDRYGLAIVGEERWVDALLA